MSESVFKKFEVKEYKIADVMSGMVKDLATAENYPKLVFKMTPDFFEKLENENDIVTVVSKDPIKRFMGIKIKVMEGTEYLTLSCDRS